MANKNGAPIEVSPASQTYILRKIVSKAVKAKTTRKMLIKVNLYLTAGGAGASGRWRGPLEAAFRKLLPGWFDTATTLHTCSNSENIRNVDLSA